MPASEALQSGTTALAVVRDREEGSGERVLPGTALAHRVAFWIGCAVGVTSLAVLVGWALDIELAKSVLLGRARMAPATAVGLIVAAAGLAVLGRDGPARTIGVVRVLAALVLTLGSVRFGEYVFEWGLDFDTLGFRDTAFVAPATAVDFMLIGAALWLASTRQLFHVFQNLTLAAGLVAWLGFASQLSGGEQLPAYAQMALHTSFLMFALSLGILCIRTDGGLMKLLVGGTAGSRIIWLLLLAPPLPLVLDIVERWVVETQAVDGANLRPLFTLLDTIVLGAFIWAFGIQLRHVDARRHAAEAQRVENERRLRLFVEHAPAAIAMLDRDMRYLAVSRRWLADYRLSERDLIGRSHYEIFPEVPDRWREIHRRCLAGAIERHEADPFPRADGAVDWVRWEIRPWQAGDDGIGGIIIFSEVITERIQAAARIERLNRVYAMLSEINSLIVRVRDAQVLFDEACRIAVEIGNFGVAWIGLVHQDTAEIVPSAQAGLRINDRLVAPIPVAPDDARNLSIPARAIRDSKAVFVNDLGASAYVVQDRYEDMLQRGFHAVIALPLIVDDFATGCLSIWSKEPDIFDEEELDLLREIANDISFALKFLIKQEELDYISYYDVLTGLPNRTLFLDRVGQQLRTRDRSKQTLGLLVLDVERFRMVNETLGRHGGDELLRAVAQRLKDTCTDEDALARIGPNAFAVALRDSVDPSDIAHEIEDRFLSCFRDPYSVFGTELRIAAKVGIALFPHDGQNTDALFRNAEAALKQAKDSGSRFLYYSAEMNAQAARALSLETRLRKAVDAQEFVLFYQPKVRLSDSRPCGLEALIRWRNPESGLIPPADFVPVLEETGLIVEVGYWALTQALADFRAWSERGINVPRVAVNVSARQLQREDFMNTVIDLVEAPGATPEALELEITESLLMRNIEHSHRALSILRGIGIHVAMDDFGTGYSSLSYLARLPVDKIKIDRSFISGMTGNALDRTVVSTIITLAHSFGFPVVAEGVETVEQAQALHDLRCDEAQGYLFSAPIPAGEVVELLTAHT